MSTSLAMSALNLLPDEIKKRTWNWKTENWSMGHGNYLISDPVENLVTLKHNAHYHEAGDIITGHYEINFCYSGWYTPIDGFYDFQKRKTDIILTESTEVRRNEARGGIEVLFESKPSQEIIIELKSNGFRWSGRQKLWWTRYTEQKMEFAQSLLVQ